MFYVSTRCININSFQSILFQCFCEFQMLIHSLQAKILPLKEFSLQKRKLQHHNVTDITYANLLVKINIFYQQFKNDYISVVQNYEKRTFFELDGFFCSKVRKNVCADKLNQVSRSNLKAINLILLCIAGLSPYNFYCIFFLAFV